MHLECIELLERFKSKAKNIVRKANQRLDLVDVTLDLELFDIGTEVRTLIYRIEKCRNVSW